ncbi:MAG: hypothetical protein K5985_11070 [Lachnospiraceae bacterium]|nr:hypothetical protein [Lachnospiraceae bacterium]
MLTLKAPVELKNRTSFVHDNDSFSHRLTDRYSITGSGVGAEELLHALTTPPDIVIAEGDYTTVAGNTVINSRNEEKLDIINNVLNRILVSVNSPLTYQDRVYITDCLNKLGIRDDRRFMSEVRRFMRRTEEHNTLIDLYFQDEANELRQDVLQWIVQELRNRGREERVESNRYFENHLSTEIMNRLQTGAIYQIVSNFTQNPVLKEIAAPELSVSEQGETAREILTQRIFNSFIAEGEELIYREDYYEGDRFEEGEGKERTREYIERESPVDAREYTTVTVEPGSTREILRQSVRDYFGEERERYLYRVGNVYEEEFVSESTTEGNFTTSVTSAVMLDLIKNLISVGYERLSRQENQWFDLRKIMYQSSGNTLSRLNIISSDNYVTTVVDHAEEETELVHENTEELVTEETDRTEENLELIREQVRQMEENNRNEVSRYQQILSILNRVRERRRSEDAAERTRRESLGALEGENVVYESLEEEAAREEEAKREAFREIIRLFPDDRGRVLSILEQFFTGRSVTEGDTNVMSSDINLLLQDIERFNERERTQELILRETAEGESEAKEELEKLRSERESVPEKRETGRERAPEAELVLRRNESITTEELEETLAQYRAERSRRVEDNIEEAETVDNRSEVHRTVTESRNVMTEQDLNEIQDMVNRGLKSQMGAISEEVLHRLERRLKNEKSRRGL